MHAQFGVKNFTSFFCYTFNCKPKLLATADSFTESTEGAVEGIFVRGSLTLAEEVGSEDEPPVLREDNHISLNLRLCSLVIENHFACGISK